jgi:hypothetical protein
MQAFPADFLVALLVITRSHRLPDRLPVGRDVEAHEVHAATTAVGSPLSPGERLKRLTGVKPRSRCLNEGPRATRLIRVGPPREVELPSVPTKVDGVRGTGRRVSENEGHRRGAQGEHHGHDGTQHCDP